MKQTDNMKRTLSGIAAAGFIAFLVGATGVQALHPVAIASTPISSYLRGPHSGWLQLSYYVLSVSLILLGACFVAMPAARDRIAGLVLVIAGCGVTLVAYTYTSWPLPGHPDHVTRVAIHVRSAFTAFLGVTIAMFIETPRLWSGAVRTRMWLFAVLVFAVELASLPGPRYTPGSYGALEKLSILGLIVWLILCARKLARAPGRS